MANQSDIKLNIVVTVSGQQSLVALQRAIVNVNAAQNQAAVNTAKTNAALKKQQDQLKGLSGRLKQAEQEYDALYRASYRLQIVGYQLINVGQQIANTFKSLTDDWGDFEFMVNRAAGALQIFSDSSQRINPLYEALIDNIQRATKELSLFPAADVAKATYFWASTSGQAVKTMDDLRVVMESVNPLMKVAALTQTGYEAVIKGTYSILVQYGKGLNEVADVTNKLHLVTQRTALEFPDLINSFKMVGPIAATLGVSFEEVAQIFGQLGDAGIRGTMSGRALRQMFIQLARPTAKAATALNLLFKNTKGIGQAFDDVVFPEGKFIGITAFIDKLAFALKDTTQAQREHILATISTANEYTILTSLVGNQIKVLKGLPGAYDAAKTSVTDSAAAANAFNKSWELLANSWKGITARIEAGAEIIRLKVGRAIADSLREAVGRVKEFLEVLEDWVDRNADAIKSLGKLLSVIGAIAAIGGAILVTTGSIIGLSTALAFMIKGFGSLVAPVTIVSGLFVALGEAILNNWTRIQRVLVPALKDLLAALGLNRATLDDLKEVFRDLHSVIRDFMDGAVKFAIGILKGLINVLADIARSPIREFLEWFAPRLLAAVVAAKLLLPIVLKIWIGLLKLTSVVAGAVAAVLRFSIALTALGGKTLGGIGLVIAGLTVLIMLFDDLRSFKVIALAVAVGIAAVTTAFILARVAAIGFMATLTAIGRTPILIALTAIVFALQQLIELNPGGIFNFLKNANVDLEETRQRIEDLAYAMGKFGPIAKAAAQDAADALYNLRIASATAEVERLTIQWEKFKGSQAANLRIGAQLAKAREELNKLRGASAAFVESQLAALDTVANKYGVASEVVAKTALAGMDMLSLSFDQAAAYADDFFKVVGDGAPTVENAIKIWNEQVKKGFKFDVSKMDFLKTVVSQEDLNRYVAEFNAKAEIAMASKFVALKDYNAASDILMGLKANSGAYSDSVNSAINNLLGNVPAGVMNIMEEATDLAEQGPKAIADAVITAFENIGDFKTQLKEAMANLPSGKEFVTQLFANVTSADLQALFASNKVGAKDAAYGFIEQLQNDFAAGVQAAKDDPSTARAMRLALENVFTPQQLVAAATGQLRTFKGVALDSNAINAIQEFVNVLWPEIGRAAIPSSTAIETAGKIMTRELPTLISRSFGEDARWTRQVVTSTGGQDAFAQAMKEMKTNYDKTGAPFLTSVKTDIRSVFSLNLYQGGWNTVYSWYKGLKAAAKNYGIPTINQILKDVSTKTSGKSPPPEGPLKNIDKGGFNVGRAWAEGTVQGAMTAVAGAQMAAGRVRDALAIESNGASLGLNVDTTNNRHLVVEVRVTSPDGSINHVDMQTLAGALSGSGLTRSLEQAAASR